MPAAIKIKPGVYAEVELLRLYLETSRGRRQTASDAVEYLIALKYQIDRIVDSVNAPPESKT
jgi:hypothetical protein